MKIEDLTESLLTIKELLPAIEIPDSFPVKKIFEIEDAVFSIEKSKMDVDLLRKLSLPEGGLEFFGFTQKLKEKHSPEGDFARDALADQSFPWKSSEDLATGKEKIEGYLATEKGCPEAFSAFRKLWKKFQAEQRRENRCAR